MALGQVSLKVTELGLFCWKLVLAEMEGQKVWVWGPVPCGKLLPLSGLSFCISEMTESLLEHML